MADFKYYIYSKENLRAMEGANYTQVDRDKSVPGFPADLCYKVDHHARLFTVCKSVGNEPWHLFASMEKPAAPAPTVKSVLKIPNDYEFIASSLTVEQWNGFCLGNIINDKLNARETMSFFNDVFNKYKDLCHA